MRRFTLVQSAVVLATTFVAWRFAASWLVAVVGAAFLGAFVSMHAGRYTPDGRFGAANAVTALRVGLVVALCAYDSVGPLSSAVVVGFSALDGLDGWIARRAPATASDFGARFDMETDALFVLAFGVKLVEVGRLGAFMILPGVLRYAYAGGIALAPGLGEAPRSRLGRFIAGIMMTSLAVSAWPLEPVFQPLAAVATALVVFSFARSTVQSLSRA
ncbi:MAG TPA: CDP-alcohol phosphatidyltransferase family protein [Polyangiaceae bacterium]|nr:CDP-alcohol phosphatidyltransferase family protein [Polyangiaceae bacterium]